MSQNYLATLHKTTVVTQAAVGNFTAENDLNLVLAKINQVCIYKIGSRGLEQVKDISIYGRVVGMKLFRPIGKMKDLIIILTAKQYFIVLGWDEARNEVITRASCSIADRIKPIFEHNSLISIHKTGVMSLRLYERAVKIIHLSDLKEDKCLDEIMTCNLSLNGEAVADFTFTESIENSVNFAYISRDSRGKNLTLCEMSVCDFEITVKAEHSNLHNTSTVVIPVPTPYEGVVVVSRETMLYYKNQSTFFSIRLTFEPESVFTCYTTFSIQNECRALIGEATGQLCDIVLDFDDMNQRVSNMKISLLGEISIPECLVHVEKDVFFIGSRLADSQFIKINRKMGLSYIQVLQTMPNIAPIRDLTLIKSGHKTRLVTCSGCHKDGSLRIIENGTGVDQAAYIGIAGIKKVFSLKIECEFDNYLIVSSDDSTHVLQIDGEEIEDVDMLIISTNTTTLWAGVLENINIIVQVTPTTVKFCTINNVYHCWYPNENLIDHVSVNKELAEIVVACGAVIYFLKYKLETNLFEQVSRKELQFQISCIDIAQIVIDDEKPSVVAVGFWTENSSAILELPDFIEITRHPLAIDVIPRFIRIAQMETVTYLLVLLGDGQFHYFTFSRETGALTYIEKVFIGAQPTALLKIDREGATNIFIGSERPIMMYSSNNKLVFSDLLSNVVVDLCLLNSEKYKNCFVISDEKALSISTIESAPRLHVRSITTGEAVKKIAYQKETNTIGILCERPEGTSKSSISKSATLLTRAGPDIAANIRNTNGSDDGMVHSFVLLNADTFEPLHTYEFPYNEHVVSITSAKLGSDPKTYYIVGTAIIRNREFRVSSGRITFFEANLGNPHFLVRVFEKHTRGCPFSVNVLRSNLIVALNSSVRVFKWIMPDRADLKLECSYFNNLSASQVKVEGDLVVVDDVLRSFGILSYNPVENTLEERARDYRGMCMTALEFIDADTIIGSDIGYNIIVGKLTKPPHFDSYEFLEKGLYHIGEAISTFQRGVFRASSLNRSISIGQPVIYGTTDGTIGMVAQIPHETYRLLAAVESVVIKKLPNYARIPYTSYRRFETEGAVDVAFGFIDGDMVEFTLKLSREDQLELFSSLQIPDYLSMNAEQTVDEVMEKVNDLARIH